MQSVNNDMDEMFRRAAENYPLDTNSADWNKVSAVLQNTEGNEVQVKSKRNDNRGRLLWLLLLLPLVFICNRYSGNVKTGNDGSAGNDIREKARVEKLGLPVKQAGSEKKKPGALGSATDDLDLKRSITNSKGSGSDVVPQETQEIRGDNTTEADAMKYKLTTNTGEAKKRKKFRSQSMGDETKIEEARYKSDHYTISPSQVSNSPLMERTMAEPLRSGKNYDNKMMLATEPLSSISKEIVKTPAPEKPKQDRSKKFYVGLLGGLDATTIKFQKVQEAGYDYGVLLGYQFGKKWSVESGVFLGKKIYYSDGKHYNTSRIYLPPNTKVKEVAGDCRMIEIPLSVKYDISTSARRSWFATLGASSYIMKKEDYKYIYVYGSGTTSTHYKSYTNESRHLFSVVQLTGGYTHRLGKVGDLRIEPYLKIPIAKIGVGKLPFFSTGIHVGITRKLF